MEQRKVLEIVRSSDDPRSVGFLTAFSFGESHVVVDCDDFSVWAYLVENDEAVGGTWLFNTRPVDPEWRVTPNPDHLDMNTDPNILEWQLDDKIYQDKLSVLMFDEETPTFFAILYDDCLLGRVWNGANPGDSSYALTNTKFAHVVPEKWR